LDLSDSFANSGKLPSVINDMLLLIIVNKNAIASMEFGIFFSFSHCYQSKGNIDSLEKTNRMEGIF
jgi:hypothetical protein